jgi:hypothetical protein
VLVEGRVWSKWFERHPMEILHFNPHFAGEPDGFRSTPLERIPSGENGASEAILVGSMVLILYTESVHVHVRAEKF